MSWYTVALFAHIVGVLTLFITMGLQWLSTLRLRQAESISQARMWSALATGVNMHRLDERLGDDQPNARAAQRACATSRHGRSA